MENSGRIPLQDLDRSFLRAEDLPLFERVCEELKILDVKHIMVTGSVLQADKNYRDIDILVERPFAYPSPIGFWEYEESTLQ